mgnify:CR=1 FL=1
MSRENYGMMNQEDSRIDEVTIDLDWNYSSALWVKEDDNYSVCSIHGTGSVRWDEDVRDTEVHVSNEAICYGKE